MSIDVLLDGGRISINKAVFVALFENSVASTYARYQKTLENSSITWADLVKLARYGEIPYVLFFAPLSVVQAQLALKTEKLLAGVSKDTFSINSREKVHLRQIELIVKDLLRKQMLVKKHDDTLIKNKVVGILKKPEASIEADANKLMNALGVTHEALRSIRTKENVREYLIERLEANQILVAQSVNNFMPQHLTHVRFSGMTIKDAKVPYIFLAGGEQGDSQEPEGRRIFTLTLLSVLIAEGIFAPVTYDGSSTGSDAGREYDIVGEILMPASAIREADLSSLAEIKSAAKDFKVTPSAITVRAIRLKLLPMAKATEYLAELEREFAERKKPPARQPQAINAVRKYNGREFSVRMLGAYDAGKISAGDFCRSVCLNHIKPGQINDFRGVL